MKESDFLKGCNIELENSNGRISEVTQNATRLEVQIKDLLSEFECINSELKPLPEECFVTMRLVYNKDTPEKYNPEGFVTDEKGDMSVSNQGEVIDRLREGQVRTIRRWNFCRVRTTGPVGPGRFWYDVTYLF